MLYHMLKQCSPAELEEDDEVYEKKALEEVKASSTAAGAAGAEGGDAANNTKMTMKKKLALRNKIKSVGKMQKMLSTLRSNHAAILELKNMSPDGKLPKGALLDARPTIEFASQQFSLVKGLDAVNEKRPKKKGKE